MTIIVFYFQIINVIDSPVICTQCFRSLQTYLNFAISCMRWEEKLRNYAITTKKQNITIQDFLHYLTDPDMADESEGKLDITIEEMNINEFKNQRYVN